MMSCIHKKYANVEGKDWCVVLIVVVVFQSRTRIVSTKYGQVQGFIERVGRDAEQLRHVEIYLGVPYASPPSGDYR